jgi:hypothetical protein
MPNANHVWVPSRIGSARKKVIAPDGKVILYMDMSVKAVTPRTFEILRAGLMKK